MPKSTIVSRCSEQISRIIYSERGVGLQGFGNGAADASHHWVETDGTLIDLGPHYLPRGSTYPAAKMPILCWQTSEPLPTYRPHAYYEPDVQLVSDPELMARMEGLEPMRVPE